MASLEQDFIEGLVFKTIILGLIAAAAFFFIVDLPFAVSVFVGAAVSVINLRFVQWITKKLVKGAERGETHSGTWTALLLLKMAALFGVIWLLIVKFDINAVGLVTGFSSFLPAIGWQVWASRDDDASHPPEDKA